PGSHRAARGTSQGRWSGLTRATWSTPGPVRPRESGDPGPSLQATHRLRLWVPAFAGTNGVRFVRLADLYFLRHHHDDPPRLHVHLGYHGLAERQQHRLAAARSRDLDHVA